MPKKAKPCCAPRRSQSVLEVLQDFEDSIEQSYRDARKLGATWDHGPPGEDGRHRLVVTWPTTNAYRNGVSQGLVREYHGHLRVEHKVLKR